MHILIGCISRSGGSALEDVAKTHTRAPYPATADGYSDVCRYMRRAEAGEKTQYTTRANMAASSKFVGQRETPKEAMSAEGRPTCDICHKTGHTSDNCWSKNTGKRPTCNSWPVRRLATLKRGASREVGRWASLH